MKREHRRNMSMPVAEIAKRADFNLRSTCMTPRARAKYRRITRLREEIGPVDFDVVEALREMRKDEG